MKNILITGGAGFIGTNLSKKLLEDGHNVYILDDLSTGRFKNVQYLKEEFGSSIQFHKCDITDLTNLLAIKNALLPSLVHEIYHLACPASPPKYYLDPLKTLATNYVGTKNILELAKAYKCSILFSSTSEIYGNPLEHPQKETYNGNIDPISPRSVYDEGKRVAETLVSEYHRQFGIRTKIARIFNTYGPFMDPDDGRVLTNFIKQYLNGKPMTIYGNGYQTRSFCHVDDLVGGLIILMNSDKFINEPVNIGNPSETWIDDLAYFISKSYDSNLTIYKPLPVSDPRRRCPDISKMKSLGWNPKISIKHGIEMMIEYMKQEIKK